MRVSSFPTFCFGMTPEALQKDPDSHVTLTAGISKWMSGKRSFSTLFVVFYLSFFLSFFFGGGAAPTAYEGSQARGRISTAAAGLHQPRQIGALSVTYTTAHSNARPLTHWARPGIQPASSWIVSDSFPLSHDGNSLVCCSLCVDPPSGEITLWL